MTIESDLLDRVSALLGRRDLTQVEFSNWLGGTTNGGPNGDGRYPMTDSTGFVRLVSCPAASTAALNAGTILALPVATTTTTGLRLVGVPANGQPASQITFPQLMTRTADLAEQQQVIGTEMLPCVTATGETKRIALASLTKAFAGGVIDATASPYNIVPDGVRIGGMTMVAGSNVVTSDVPIFIAQDVGKVFRMSDVGQAGTAIDSTIVSVQDSKHITLAHTAQGSKAGGEAAWGTDNTVGMRLAMQNARGTTAFSRGGVVILPPGGIITRWLTIGQGTALIGRGRDQTTLMHWREPNNGSPLLGNAYQFVNYNGQNYAPEFQFLQDFGIDGLRYQNPYGAIGTNGYQHLIDTDPSGVTRTLSGDPLHYYVNLKTDNCSQQGFSIFGRHSGTINGLDCTNNQLVGFENCGFDVNILNVLCIANGGPGYMSGSINSALYNDFAQNATGDYQIPASSGCNVQNLKVSFNGENPFKYIDYPNGGGRVSMANMVECGNSNVYTALRLQESMGDNLLLWGTARFGPAKNKFSAVVLDDTADQFYPRDSGIGDFDPPLDANFAPWRGSISFVGAGCKYNYFFDATAGAAVRHRDYASHSAFFSRDAQDNYVRMFQIDHTAQPYINPTWTANPTPYLPGPVGTDSWSGGIGARGNNVQVNGTTYS